ASSAVQPKTLPPNTSGAMSRPERPSGRLFMMISSVMDVCRAALVDASGNGLDRTTVDAQRRAGGGAGLRRGGIDAEVGDFFRRRKALQQVGRTVFRQEQRFHFRCAHA